MEPATKERSIFRLSCALAMRLTSRASLPLAAELEDLCLVEGATALAGVDAWPWAGPGAGG